MRHPSAVGRVIAEKGAHVGPSSNANGTDRESGLRSRSKPDLILKAGQPLQFALEEVHNVCNVGGAPFKAIAHYIVQKGKPLVSRAP